MQAAAERTQETSTAAVAEKAVPKIAKSFIVQKNNKDFVLYAGLLDLAHRMGLQSIRTEIVQIPTEENGRVAIVTALVTMERDGNMQAFSGIGDADYSNVSQAMKTCLLRMAETRSKARALRDAVNAGVAAYEELAEEGEHAPAARTRGTARGGGSKGGTIVLNTSDVACTVCHAPAGKPHGTGCSFAAAQSA